MIISDRKILIYSLFALLVFVSSCKEVKETKLFYTKMVVPTVDTENSRWFFFTSASRPFGMVNLSPDTETKGAWGSGYRYQVDTIKGFSHIHAWQLAGPSVMPVTRDADCSDYYSPFSHDKEEITPGYHRVYLERFGITAELTSTKRVGFHRYQFKADENPVVLFNLNGELGPSLMKNGSVVLKDGMHRMIGEVTNEATFRRPKDCKVFFIVDFSAPVDNIEKDTITGNYRVSFQRINEPLLMKVAISYTSNENAAKNMEEELPGWDFDKVVKDSQEEWNNMLSRIKVEGGTSDQQKRFYTDLWHALQGRRIISDVNGDYPDNTGELFRIGHLPVDENGKPLFNHYNSDSFWGAQWTINTLWGLVYPEIADEFVQSLMQYYKDGGLVPRGPSGGNYTYVMTGASSTPFIVSAIQKGIVKDNIKPIYEALKKNHLPGGIMSKSGYEHNTNIGGGLNNYIKENYIPYPLAEVEYGAHQDGVSQTLENAYQDWTLAQLAHKLRYVDDERYFTQRSFNYQNVFDSISGWMRPRNKCGQWKADFDPYQIDNGFIEANGAQATWFVPHNIEDLATLMGGKKKAADKLHHSFIEAEQLGFTAGTSHDRETHPEFSRIPINYGNQPSIQTAFIFNYLDKPWLTQYWSRKVVETVYEGIIPARGYNGDEDQGLMGSLAVLMKMGLFSMKGGCSLEPQLEIGSPIFDKITIELNSKYYTGNKLIIKTEDNSDQNVFVQSAEWNGKELKNWSLPQNDLVKGGTLILNMGSEPNKQWTSELK
ncbi:GH92 family glycosyl hydrolase [Carboxylicivirga linearis]|uniref:GH92 family glycosyl hydrolase n=2 Tax=Carboxylicivirga linearis TaxID=1628157 RepID=A0ABS5JXW9_9BACT|nr:GH92 family glycosyl hydrolase [Carboxylicivirga linearis]